LTAGVRERTRGVAPEFLVDSGRIVWGFFRVVSKGIFVSSAGALVPSPWVISGKIAWGFFVSGRMCVYFSRDRVANHGVELRQLV